MADHLGTLRPEERAPGGYEIEVSGLRVLHQVAADDPFPITPKEHGVDFPGLRRSGSWSQIINRAQDFPEQFPRHRHLRQLERDMATMARSALAPISPP